MFTVPRLSRSDEGGKGISRLCLNPAKCGAGSVARASRCRYPLRDGEVSIATEGAARGVPARAPGPPRSLVPVLAPRLHARAAVRLPGAARVLRPELPPRRATAAR